MVETPHTKTCANVGPQARDTHARADDGLSKPPMLPKSVPARFDAILQVGQRASKIVERQGPAEDKVHDPTPTCVQDSAFNKPKSSKICGHPSTI
jgi:hypothetical protein